MSLIEPKIARGEIEKKRVKTRWGREKRYLKGEFLIENSLDHIKWQLS
jgi:hypothetical protein